MDRTLGARMITRSIDMFPSLVFAFSVRSDQAVARTRPRSPDAAAST
jgi:hypothetical protein